MARQDAVTLSMSPDTSAPPPATAQADFRLLLILFAVFRVLTLFLLRPGGFIRDWSDFDTFLGIAALSDYGLYPFLDFWMEWPPLVPWLMVGAYRVSLLLPLWEDPRLWFVLILGSVFLLFEIGNFSLLYRLGRRITSDPATITRMIWFYAGLFVPLYTLLGFFDGLALFFMLLALFWLIEGKNRLAGVAIGLGIMTKVTPILMLPVAGKTIWQRGGDWRRVWADWGWLLLTTVGAVLLIAAPFLLLAPEWLLAFGRAMAGRSSWETVWAVWEGYYGFGVVGGDRLNPAETNFAIHPATLPWTAITAIFALFYGLLLLVRADFSRPRTPVALAGLTIIFFLLYSKGYSPQFMVYLFPFIVLLLPNMAGLGYALILTALNILEQPIYFVFFDWREFPAEGWLLTGIVWARLGVLLALGLEFGLILADRPGEVGRRVLRWMVVGGAIVGLLGVIPFSWQAYQRVQLARNPQQDLIGYLRSQQGVAETLILLEQPLYQQLYPHLRSVYHLQLAGDDSGFPTAPTVAQLVADRNSVWLIIPQNRLEPVLSGLDSMPVQGQHGLGGGRVLALLGTATLPEYAHADNGITLMSYQLVQEREALVVTLFWQTDQPQTVDYTVFTQLLDGTGARVTGHDGLPVEGAAPTSTWQPGQLIVDQHRLPLPTDLAPGVYHLTTGMYDATLNRLAFLNPSGEPLPEDAIPLTAVELP